MTRSFAESVELTCAGCRASFNTTVWLIVDADERPDLVERIVDETLHVAQCPNCGTPHPIDAPLLFHDAADQLLVFASPEQSTAGKDQQIAQQLGQQLIGSIPIADRATYLTTAHIVRGMAGLRQVLLDDETTVGDDLSQALPALMEATSPAAVREVVEAHPVLGTDEALEQLREYVRRLREADQPELALALEHRIAAMRQAQPNPTLAFIQALLDAPSPEERRALLTSRPQDVTPEVPTILEALADQAQRRHLEAVARDMLVIRDEVLGSLGRDIPLTPSA